MKTCPGCLERIVPNGKGSEVWLKKGIVVLRNGSSRCARVFLVDVTVVVDGVR